ncbi:MAG: hypothetical protein ABIS50_17505 [Luteolibacter sp.]|uniref:hypothetical protein n=1 Tax=Luteolibacter sp. TaxID=1962973 RepID=UPI00326317EA
MNAWVGSLTASEEWFMPWRTISSENDKPQVEFELAKIVRGFFRPDLFLDYVRYFILFEEDGGKLIKKIAGYHQFHGVRESVRVTMIAAKPVDEDGPMVREDRATYGREVIPGSRNAGGRRRIKTGTGCPSHGDEDAIALVLKDWRMRGRGTED